MLDTTFSRLVGGIYDAVIDPELWPEAIDAIRQEFRFLLGVLTVVKVPTGELAISAASNIPEDYLRTVGRYGEDLINLWGGAGGVARLPLEEPIVFTEARPRHLWEDNRYYLEWVKPQEIVDQVAMVLANDRTTNASIGLACHVSRGPVEPETRADLRLLAPHMRRAVVIGRLLDMTTNAAATRKSVAAVFIADTGGQPAVPMDALSLLFELTSAESRVLELTVAGHSSREVAEALGVAPSTVKTHMLNVFEKTGRHRREDLVRLANEVSLP